MKIKWQTATGIEVEATVEADALNDLSAIVRVPGKGAWQVSRDVAPALAAKGCVAQAGPVGMLPAQWERIAAAIAEVEAMPAVAARRERKAANMAAVDEVDRSHTRIVRAMAE